MIIKLNMQTSTLEPEYFDCAESIVSRRLSERGGDVDSVALRLEYNKDLHSDGYRISEDGGGFLIESNSKCGILAGVGRFLRDGQFRGEFFPKKPFRGIYFATHFHNFYHSAPLEKIHRLQEDLALWGQNILTVWYDMHHYKSIGDPAAVEFAARLKAIMKHANKLGIKTMLVSVANEAFSTSPEELRAEWRVQNGYAKEPHSHYNIEICPSKPGGIEKILEYRLQTFRLFEDVMPDYITIWPYDQGGCTCKDCAPWAAKGYLKCVKAIAELLKKEWPKTKIIMSGWYFERFYPGEWDRFFEATETEQETEKDGYSFAEYFTAYFPESMFSENFKIPEQILNGKTPAGIPLIDFPEISMQGANPWGGFGANSQPKWLQEIENKSGHMYKGGYAYSEGIYEDINKIIILSLYSGIHSSTAEAIREYARFEFSAEHADEIAEILHMMESTLPRWRENTDNPDAPLPYRFIINNTEKTDEIYRRTMAVDEQLDEKTRAGWRWRLIYLRAKIDYELAHNNFFSSSVCEKCFEELTELYYAQNGDYIVSPPTKASVLKIRGKEV
jgi:hypothetical protein